jgi:hypothetical protein
MRAAHAKRKADACYRASVIVGRVDNRSMAQVPGALLAPADGASGR